MLLRLLMRQPLAKPLTSENFNQAVVVLPCEKDRSVFNDGRVIYVSQSGHRFASSCLCFFEARQAGVDFDSAI